MKGIIELKNMYKTLSIKFDSDKNILLVNEKPIKYDASEFLYKLQTIIASWDKVMINNSVSDGEIYSVKLKLDNKTREYIGKNKFPENYYKFIALINEVAEW